MSTKLVKRARENESMVGKYNISRRKKTKKFRESKTLIGQSKGMLTLKPFFITKSCFLDMARLLIEQNACIRKGQVSAIRNNIDTHQELRVTKTKGWVGHESNSHHGHVETDKNNSVDH